MTTGSVSVKVVNSAGTTIISGTGPIAVSPATVHAMLLTDKTQVVSTASLCNYNFQVVGLA